MLTVSFDYPAVNSWCSWSPPFCVITRLLQKRKGSVFI